MNVVTEGGLSASDAYIRVVPVRFLKDAKGFWNMRVRVTTFKDAETAENNGHPLNVIFDGISALPYPLVSTENVLSWAYTELKKMSEFADAVDV